MDKVHTNNLSHLVNSGSVPAPDKPTSIRWTGIRRFDEKVRVFALNRLTVVERNKDTETPAHYQLPFESLRFLSRDNLNLHGWYIPVQNSRATIIVAHGYGGSKARSLRFARWLWQAGYSVFTFDFRGHGLSEGPRGTSVGFMERLDVLGALDYLWKRGDTKLGLFGFSMGASACIMAAADYPMVKVVVADSPYAHLYRSISTQVRSKGHLPRWLAVSLAKFGYLSMAQHHGFRADHGHPADYIERIAPRPIMLLHGSGDSLTEVENSLILFNKAQEPKQLWVEPGVEHTKMYQVMPVEYERRILEFLSKINWNTI